MSKGENMGYDIKYKKQTSESYDDFWWRLCSSKDLGVYSLTWDEVADILNAELGEDFTSSKWRKNYQMMKKGFDKARQENADAEDILNEIEVQKDELYKQQVRTRDKLREYRSTLRDEARVENLKDVFIECARDISTIKPLRVSDSPTVKSNGNNVAVLSLSDLHYGEVINNFMNEYNSDVFYDRMIRLTEETIDYCQLMGVKTLKVLNLGDWISGNIHVSTRVNSEEDSVEQTMIVAETVSEMLKHFARHIELVEFYSVTDNHSRINKNKKEHIEKESFSRFIPWFVKERVSSIKNISVISNIINEVEEFEIGMFDIFDEKAFFVHGHNDRLTSVVPDLTLITKIFPIAVFIGHLHKNYEDEIHGIDLIMNPSAVGTGEYAKNIRKSSKPRQKLTIYSKGNGEVERVATFLINL